MAATETVRLPAHRDPVSAKILRGVGKLPLQIFLVVVGLLWLVPTIGLFITSILPASELTTSGWWKVFAHPSLATFSNYSALIHNARRVPG
jgi:alpha-glucoside transport system permease protein